MLKENPFVRKADEYVRDLSIMKHNVEDHAAYLSKMTGKDYKYCLDYVIRQFKSGGKFEFKDPSITYLERNEYGDRELKEGKLLEYINYGVENNHHIAPTLTTYLNSKQKKSLTVGYIESNIRIRNIAKKEMFAAKMSKNKRLQLFKKGEQMNKKILTNGITGAHVSSSSPLCNKTAHSTLTSNCRSTSAFGNANNEKLLAGNRHYHHPTIAFNNIISIIQRTDLVELDRVMVKYGLHYPTPIEVNKCVMRSSYLYWRSPENEKRIFKLLESLTPIELAAVLYVGDLYYLREYNQDFMRMFIGNIAERTMMPVEDPGNVFSANRSEYVGLVVQLFGDSMKGKEISSVVSEDIYKILAANVDKIHNHLLDVSDFIKAFLVTDNVPASLAFLPDSVRRLALTSDTDSTIFTVQDWIKWYEGSYEVNDHSNAIAATMIFLAAESITHVLAKMSANFGVEKDRIFQIAMKNEFRFDVFTPTNIGKHYFALIGCQEGNLLETYDAEIKGVHLRSSNVAVEVIKQAENMMVRLMDLACKAKPFHITPFLKEIADLERSVVASIYKGEKTYLKSGQIKSANSYKNGEVGSPYQHYKFWNDVFASKYGETSPPPYTCSKISVNLKNQNAIKAWIESIKDPVIKRNLTIWNEREKKTLMNMFLIPTDLLMKHGIPEEMRDILEIRRAVLDVSKVFYIIMEALGIYMLNDKITRLIMDEY